MSNNQDQIKAILENVKPDASMAMEALKKANDTISMLINQSKNAEARWTELFIILGTLLNKYDKEIRLEKEFLLALSPQDYQITIETDEDTEDKIIRLRHITYKPEE
jgi:hypothetical protein